MNRPLRIALTPGEPAGIGPELAVQIAQQPQDFELVCIANGELLQRSAHDLDVPLSLRPFNAAARPRASAAGEVTLVDIPLGAEVLPGQLDVRNADHVLESLTLAARYCLNKHVDALVTGPVQKSVMNDAGIEFSGHTEFFAKQSATPTVVMMLATDTMRVALATTHIPLRAVADAITPDLLRQVIAILYRDLQSKFGLASPRILVCGLNPHAGEGGHLGREEIDVIAPTLQALRTEGMDLLGPLPADTLFTTTQLQGADAVLAMYHDQGLPVLKHQGFGKAVNITLGLPFIRTSVDHGTALAQAGKGTASPASLKVALESARQMASLRPE